MKILTGGSQSEKRTSLDPGAVCDVSAHQLALNEGWLLSPSIFIHVRMHLIRHPTMALGSRQVPLVWKSKKDNYIQSRGYSMTLFTEATDDTSVQ